MDGSRGWLIAVGVLGVTLVVSALLFWLLSSRRPRSEVVAVGRVKVRYTLRSGAVHEREFFGWARYRPHAVHTRVINLLVKRTARELFNDWLREQQLTGVVELECCRFVPREEIAEMVAEFFPFTIIVEYP